MACVFGMDGMTIDSGVCMSKGGWTGAVVVVHSFAVYVMIQNSTTFQINMKIQIIPLDGCNEGLVEKSNTFNILGVV